jgi:predicted PurR-regulated permease PerM
VDREQLLLSGLAGLAIFVAFLMVRPFLAYFLGAVVLALILYPLQQRLKEYIGPSPSALSLVFAAILVVVIPLSLLSFAAVQDAQNLASDLDESEVFNTSVVENSVQQLTGVRPDIETSIDAAVRDFTSLTFGSISAYITLLTDLGVGLTLTMFLAYYFLKDGENLFAWFRSVTPVSDGLVDSLSEEVRLSTNALIKNQLMVAVVQGSLMGAGFYLLGIPNPAFWSFVMAILGFIPMIGTLIVWLPAAGYLFLLDRALPAFGLVLYGYSVMILTGNVLTPLFINRGSNIHPAAVLLGVLGGLYLFGAAGLFIGPILMAVLKPTLEVLSDPEAQSRS